jgi:hypothetical protein
LSPAANVRKINNCNLQLQQSELTLLSCSELNPLHVQDTILKCL